MGKSSWIPGGPNVIIRGTVEAESVLGNVRMKARGWADGGRGHESKEEAPLEAEKGKETCCRSEPPEGTSSARTLTG